MPIPEKIKSAKDVYYDSMNMHELEAAAVELEGVLRELAAMKSVSEARTKNTTDAEVLYLRINSKLLCIKYFDGGFCPDDGVELRSYLSEAVATASRKEYTNTTVALSKIKLFADSIAADMDEVFAIFTALFSDSNEFVGAQKDTKKAIEFLTKAIEHIQAIEDTGNPFGDNVIFFDLKAKTLDEITGACRRLQKELERLEQADGMKLYRSVVSIVEPQSPGYPDYYPTFNDRISANVIVLRTPFADEAKLYLLSLVKNTERKVGSIDAHSIVGKDTVKLFEACTLQETDCLIFNLCDVSDKTELLASAMRAGKRGQKIFIVDDNPVATVYEAAMDVAKNDDGLSTLDVGCRYLTMPYLHDLTALFTECGMIDGSESEKERIRKAFPFMGYVGLNRVMQAHSRGEDWFAIGSAISDENLAFARAYIAELPTLAQIINSEWRAEELVTVSGGKRGDRKPIDYDDLQGINHENIKKILESRGSFFAKCGALARYCLLGGNDISQWELVDIEERSRRFTLGTRLVMRMLDTGLDPVVEILPKKEWNKIYNEGFGGMCCDGGKLIRYREDCTENFNWSVETICHESFHAFQHYAERVGFYDWYFSELGVTKYRVDEWTNNHSCYFGSEPNNSYRVQIIEADAYAFMHDCNEQGSLLWHKIDFE